MCGRFTLAAPAGDLVEVFGVAPLTFEVHARYNIGPGQDALVVGEDRKGRRMGPMHWGLRPAGRDRAGKGTGSGTGFVNARGETAATTPAFRAAMARRRCLVPADGFYEWRSGPEGKIPFLFRPGGGGLLALAAVWEHGGAPGQDERHGFAILTVEANSDVAPVHHRMPVVVAPADFDTWLGAGALPRDVRALVRPAPAGFLRRHAVSSRVNSVSHDDAGLVEPARVEEEAP